MFDKEIKLLWLILGVFNITYLVRAVWDSTTNEFYVNYGEMVSVMLLAILWDFVPVMILLVFHYHNYKAQASSIETVNQEEDTTTQRTSFISKNEKSIPEYQGFYISRPDKSSDVHSINDTEDQRLYGEVAMPNNLDFQRT